MMGPDLQRFLEIQRKGKLMWHGGWLDPNDPEVNAQIRAAAEAARLLVTISRASAETRTEQRFKDLSEWNMKYDREMRELCWNCHRHRSSGHAEVPISPFNYQTHWKCLWEPTWYEPVGPDRLLDLWAVASSISRNKHGEIDP